MIIKLYCKNGQLENEQLVVYLKISTLKVASCTVDVNSKLTLYEKYVKSIFDRSNDKQNFKVFEAIPRMPDS